MRPGLFPALCVLALAAAACGDLQGSGKTATRQVPLPGAFSAVQVEGALQVVIRRGDAQTIVAEADENLLDLLVVESKKVDGADLVIRTTRGWRSSNPFRVTITTPALRGIRTQDAATASADSLSTAPSENAWAVAKDASRIEVADWTADALQVGAHGASAVTIAKTTAKKLGAQVSGSSQAHVTCDVDEAKLNVEGASRVDGTPLRAKKADVVVAGASHAELDVSEFLKADAIGVASVIYGGEPKVEATAGRTATVKKR